MPLLPVHRMRAAPRRAALSGEQAVTDVLLTSQGYVPMVGVQVIGFVDRSARLLRMHIDAAGQWFAWDGRSDRWSTCSAPRWYVVAPTDPELWA